MKVETKILLLLILIVVTFTGGLAALKLHERNKFQRIAEDRAVERTRMFDEFLSERGDNLKILVDDYTRWDDMVRAAVKEDTEWAENNISSETLTTYTANAVWIYKADRTLFYSHNNRYSDSLRELPVPAAIFDRLSNGERTCHFFFSVPQGWMEVRGATIHPSRDAFRQTRPQGFLFAAHFWIDENIRRSALFTGYEINILPTDEALTREASEEEKGLITFARVLNGWDGEPVAQIKVRADSPIIRELNRSSERLFAWLMIFAVLLFCVLALSLNRWVRRPLHLISRNLRAENREPIASLAARRDEFGELAGLIFNFRQTEQALHRVEEELRHSQKLEALGRLAGGVAHDFNNLLTAILGYAELLQHRVRGDPVASDQARMVTESGERAAALTRQLLAFSRKQLLQPVVMDLNALVGGIERLLQRVIGEHIKLEVIPGAADPNVKADPGQVEQVILNLGVNGRDAMPGGGKLTIETGNKTVTESDSRAHSDLPAGRYVTLAVRDTGTGMDADTRSRIFEPFFTTKGPGKGTGLGLATVYGIVAQSGGAITVESEPGSGSIFCVSLPLAEGPLEERKPSAPPVALIKHSETVLVAEDEDVVRQLVCTILEEFGYKVLCAASGAEAIKIAQEHPGTIDILVTDVVMPEMHGPELASHLSKQRPELKVLYVSGYSENDISEQGVLYEGLEVLQKPFSRAALAEKIRKILDSPARSRHSAGSGA